MEAGRPMGRQLVQMGGAGGCGDRISWQLDVMRAAGGAEPGSSSGNPVGGGGEGTSGCSGDACETSRAISILEWCN